MQTPSLISLLSYKIYAHFLTIFSAFMDQVNSSKIEITAEQWPAFMYDDEMGLEPDDD